MTKMLGKEDQTSEQMSTRGGKVQNIGKMKMSSVVKLQSFLIIF